MKILREDFVDRQNFHEVINQLPDIDSKVIFEERYGNYVLFGTYEDRGFVDLEGKIYNEYLDVCSWKYRK